MSIWKKVIWSGVTGIGGVLIKTGANILVIPFLLSHLGASQYGLYVLVISLVEMSLLLDFGFSASLIKELGSQADHDNHLLKQQAFTIGQWLYGALGLILLVLGYVISPYLIHQFHIPAIFLKEAEIVFQLSFVICAIYLYNSYFRAVLMSHCLHQWVNIGHFINNVFGNLLGVVAVWQGYGLTGFFIARLFSAVVMTIFLRWQTLRVEQDALVLLPEFNKPVFKRLISFSAHTSLIQLSILLAHRIDAFVIGANLSLVAVSLFEVLSRIMGIIAQMVTQVSQVFFPLYTRLIANKEYEQARSMFLTSSMLLNLMAGMMIIPVLINLKHIIAFLSASHITIHWPLAIVLALVCWSGALQAPAGLFLLGSGHQKSVSQSSLIAAVANLLISIALVKPLGIFGVALGTLVPQGAQHQFWLVRQACNELNVSYAQYFQDVHARLIPIWLVAFASAWGIQWLLATLEVPAGWIVVASGLISVQTSLLSWYLVAAKPSEKQLMQERFLSKLSKKLQPTLAR